MKIKDTIIIIVIAICVLIFWLGLTIFSFFKNVKEFIED
jgi:hypothetical protein